MLAEPLAVGLTALRDAASGCAAEVRAAAKEAGEDAGELAAVRAALASLDDMQRTAERILAAFGPDIASRREVVWMDRPQVPDPRRQATLRVAPLEVGGLLAERLFRRRRVVLTSATLALGGSFQPLARQWGLPALGTEVPAPAAEVAAPGTEVPATGTEVAAPGDEVAAPEAGADQPGDAAEGGLFGARAGSLAWTGLDVGSPFNHPRSGILYVARHLPPPGRDGLPAEYLTELRELITAAGGRTLGLFSSMRAARQAAGDLRAELDQPLLCQGDDATAELVRQFAADEATCLFGTLSLWQGVDVPGPSLQLVVIDRIPFPARTTRWPRPGSGWWRRTAATGSWPWRCRTPHCCSPRARAGCCAPWRTGAWWRCSTRGWPPRGTAGSCAPRCRRSGSPPTRPWPGPRCAALPASLLLY